MMSSISGLTPVGTSGKKIRYPYSRFQAEFYKVDGTIISTDTVASQSRTGRSTSDVTSADTWKTVASPMGTFSVNLVPRQLDYFEELNPGDWCELRADNGDGRGMRSLMYGPVSQVRQQRSTGNKGETKTSVMVRGSDFGRAIAMTTAIYDAKLADDPAFTDLGLSRIVSQMKRINGSPGAIIRALIGVFYGADIKQWIDPKFGETFGVVDLDLDYISEELSGEAIVQPFKLSSTLWETLRQWANVSMNEMFIDYRPPFSNKNDFVNLVPAIVLRQYPFYGDDWKNLTAFKIDRSEIVNDNWSKSDADVKNWIRANDEPSITGIREGLVVFSDKIGTVNPESVKQFGFRRHEMVTPFLFDTSDPDSTPKPIQNILQEYTGYQTMWNHSNERLINGTVDTYFRPDIRVGYRLDYEDIPRKKQLQFYIQAVGHRMVYPGASTTTIHVTRGQDPTDTRFTSSADELRAQGIIDQLGDTMDRIGSALT